MKKILIAAMFTAVLMLSPMKVYAYERADVTDEEMMLMARCVMSEAGSEPFECKIAVAETIVNRTLSEDPLFPDTVTDVLYQDNQYSMADNGEVTDECYEAVEIALNEPYFDKEILYFRLEHYHNFATPYKKIGKTYFSC